MKPFSSRLFNNSVTITPVVIGQDKAGGRTKTWPAGGAVDYQCNFNPGLANRRTYQGATQTVVSAIAAFRSDPGTKVDDQVIWHAPGGDRTYTAFGPANPPSGGNALWTVELIEPRKQ